MLGAALVFFFFPKRDDEERLLAEYHVTDTTDTRERPVLRSGRGPILRHPAGRRRSWRAMARNGIRRYSAIAKYNTTAATGTSKPMAMVTA